MINKSILNIALSISIVSLLVSINAKGSDNNSQEQFVDIKKVIPSVAYDIRYSTNNNFVGERISGYLAQKCYIHRTVINDLQIISADLAAQGYRLKLFDCYRPEKAVAHFMRWAQDLADTKTKREYYPNLTKSSLVGDYIAEKSGHSKGYTLDLTLQKKLENDHWQDVDMGSPFDLFDVKSNTDNSKISNHQKQNRYFLKNIMQAHEFSNYAMEWWHFTHTKTSKSQRQKSYDFDVK